MIEKNRGIIRSPKEWRLYAPVIVRPRGEYVEGRVVGFTRNDKSLRPLVIVHTEHGIGLFRDKKVKPDPRFV
jgi:hypothetical protein